MSSMQSFTVIVSWFVLTVTLGEFLCTRAKRAGTNKCVSNFWLQIALSETPHFGAVGFWGKTRLFMTERITCALIRQSSSMVLLGHFQGHLHNNDMLHFTEFLVCSCDFLLVLTVHVSFDTVWSYGILFGFKKVPLLSCGFLRNQQDHLSMLKVVWGV